MKQQTVIPPRASRSKEPQRQKVADLPARPLTTEPTTEQLIFVERERRHSLVPYFLLGVGIVLVGLLVWSRIVLPWWANVNDQWHYGDARITRFTADVGHGGMSTFIAFDLDGSIIIIEMPGGSIDHARLYRTANLIGENADHRIVTLSIADVDGVKDCLIVHVEGATSDVVLYNNRSSFQWTKPQ